MEYDISSIYYEGYLFNVNVISRETAYGKTKIHSDLEITQSYIPCDSFEYELPETLNIIEYNHFEERIKKLSKIIEEKIFEKL